MSFGRGVVLTSTFVHQSFKCGSLCGGLCVYKCVHLHLCLRAERWRHVERERERKLIRNQRSCFLCLRLVPEMKGRGGGGVGAGESLSECLPAQWRDRYVPIMGECCDLNSPSHPSKNSSAVKPAWCQLGWSEQTYASFKKKKNNPDESAY